MERFTPEMVLAAYVETGLKPAQGDYFPAPGQACGLGVMAVQGGYADINSNDVDMPDDIVQAWYRHGFANGFDGSGIKTFMDDDYTVGYADGAAAWSAVKHLSGISDAPVGAVIS